MKYLECKCVDKNKYYLFKSGMFYVFIDKDAKDIAKYVELKLINLNKNILKCGFPCSKIDKYMDIFNNIGLCVEIVDGNRDNVLVDEDIIREIKMLDIDNISPIQAMDILYKFKEKLSE